MSRTSDTNWASQILDWELELSLTLTTEFRKKGSSNMTTTDFQLFYEKMKTKENIVCIKSSVDVSA